MSGKIEFMKLYEATSSNGNRYYRGRLNGLRLVGFPVEAKDDQDAHIQLYVSADDKGGGNARNQASDRSSNVARSQRDERSNGYAREKGRRSGIDPRADMPPPLDDDLPFGA